MDPLSLAVGAGIAVAAGLAGHVSGRFSAARQRPEVPPQPICGCTHHRSMHTDGGKGGCMVAVPRDTYSKAGAFIGKQPHKCACQQYVGPEPITSLWTPPVLPEGSDR